MFNDAQPWISSKDIELGKEWFTELRTALESTRFAIVCLTQRNAASPWVMFEAGAVAGKLQGLKLVVVQLEGDVTDLVDPLARFNSTRFDRAGMQRLFEAGYALARGLPCRFMVHKASDLPFLMRKLPEVFTHVSISDADEWKTYDDLAKLLVKEAPHWFGPRHRARLEK